MPLQLIGFAWLWADSDSQLSRLIRQGENTIAALLSRILASGSAADLQGLLAASNLGPLPPLESGSLADQKQQLSEAIAITRRGVPVVRLVPTEASGESASERRRQVREAVTRLQQLRENLVLEGDLRAIAREGLD